MKGRTETHAETHETHVDHGPETHAPSEKLTQPAFPQVKNSRGNSRSSRQKLTPETHAETHAPHGDQGIRRSKTHAKLTQETHAPLPLRGRRGATHTQPTHHHRSAALMNTTTAAAEQVAVFNPRSTHHTRRLIAMYQAYMLEELERTGTAAPGLPAAGYLKTLLLHRGNDIAGFCSLDGVRHSVELLYIDPQYRGHGIATTLLARLAATCPRPMRLKAPLTPGGQALADRLGLSVADYTETELRRAVRGMERLHQAIQANCPHKGGNPAAVCRRCYRKTLRRAAAAAVTAYVFAAQQKPTAA